jgi:S-formylglutathione hydrolase FrmB
LVKYGLAGTAAVVAAGATGFELVSHGVLPGEHELDELDGACSVASTPLALAKTGPSIFGSFFSHARQQAVGYTIGYPPEHRPRMELPLVVMLHGEGGNHTDALAAMSPAQAVALQIDGRPLAPMAMVTVDGGTGYWNPHPGDNPMAMVIDELIPMCRAQGLGRQRIGTMGISMGGYGAILLAEKYPHLIDAVAAISPAIWTSYSQAKGVNPVAYASTEDFSANDVVTHASALVGIPVRVASGYSYPFHPGVQALADALPRASVVVLSGGCHTGPFFIEQEPRWLAFLSAHLVAE